MLIDRAAASSSGVECLLGCAEDSRLRQQSAATGGYCESRNLLPFLESLPKHLLPGIQIDNESRVVKVLVSLGLADGKPIPFSGKGNAAFYDRVTADKE